MIKEEIEDILMEQQQKISTYSGLDNSRTCVRDVHEIINFTNCCT